MSRQLYFKQLEKENNYGEIVKLIERKYELKNSSGDENYDLDELVLHLKYY